MYRKLLTTVFGLIVINNPVWAHFQLLYVPESSLDRGGSTRMALVFTHPFRAGSTMDMGEPQSFYLLHQRGEEGKQDKLDLMQYLQPVTWTSLGDTGRAYVADLPSRVIRSLGDYVFVLVPSPYYEEEEDKYIQQITKMVMNVGGVPGNWATPVGLPTEILPLDKPYANWTGGVFRGVVVSDGKPVADAELEIEYVNHVPDLENFRFGKEPSIEAPHNVFQTMGIKTNSRGEFTIGLPKSGWWGICALDVGPDDEFEGKELSQDAVIWIQVTDME